MSDEGEGRELPDDADQVRMMAYLITAKRYQERGIRAAITEETLAVALPMAEFLHREGYRRVAPPSSWEYRVAQDGAHVWPFGVRDEEESESLEACRTVIANGEVDGELERRHPAVPAGAWQPALLEGAPGE